MNLTACCVIIVASLSGLLFLPELPSLPQCIILLLLSVMLVFIQHRLLQGIALAIWVFIWGISVAQQQLRQIDNLTTRPIQVEVTVSEVQPIAQRILVTLRQQGKKTLFPALSAWLYTDDPSQEFCAGQRWNMRLRLRPVHSLLNEGGYDQQRYALANGRVLQGRVLAKTRLNASCSLRSQVISASATETKDLMQVGVIRALLFGLRDEIPTRISQLFRDTGIAHLMAISGMHIGLVAGAGWLLARSLQKILPLCMLRPEIPRAGSWLLAAGYTWLSGAQPPALRAMLALTLWTLFRYCHQNFSSWQNWLLCGALLLFSDPLLVLSDSFWLSWLAVLMLLVWYCWFPLPKKYARHWRWHLLQLLHLQGRMLLLMLPLQTLLFNGISLSALAANLVAIPLVSLITLPLSGLALLLLPFGLSPLLWRMADLSLQALVLLLESPPPGWIALTDFRLWAMLGWGGLIGLRLSLYRHYLGHCLTLLLCCLLWREPMRKELWRIDMLDVGHGLSVIIRQGDEAVIYDTGNRWKETSAGQRIILPWLLQQRLQPQQVIISHRHLDHYGGWPALHGRWPELPLRTAFKSQASQKCYRGDRWQWQRLTFTVLWPVKGAKGLENNNSCVIRVSDGRFSLLLTGDLERQGEQQLVALEKEKLRSTFIQVPHHGSNTSSSAVILRQVKSEVAMASLARYNAWKMPSPKVISRYRQQGSRWLDTAVSGQISVLIYNDDYRIFTLRDEIFPRWYHQWFGVKPEYR